MKRLLDKSLDSRTGSLLRRLGEVAQEEEVGLFLVGGPVRDLLLGRPLVDLDVTVEGDGIAFAHRAAQRMGGAVKAHQRFGTAVLVLPPKIKLDVATARCESYPRPGALPRVEGGSIREDLARRDFTINSMAVHLLPARFGTLLDFFAGRSDLEAGVIRVLHEGSFRDDPTRLFRAIRFERRFGFRLDRRTERLLRQGVKARFLDTVSGERIRQEILLILGERDAGAALSRLARLGICSAIDPGFKVTERDARGAGSYDRAAAGGGSAGGPEGQAKSERMERLLVLMAGVPETAAERLADRLRLSRMFRRWLADLSSARVKALPILSRRRPLKPSQIHRLLAPYQVVPLRVLRARADSKLAARRLDEYLRTLRGARTRITGEDLAALGAPPGPCYREILGRILAARLDGEAQSRAEELELARRLIGEGRGGSSPQSGRRGKP